MQPDKHEKNYHSRPIENSIYPTERPLSKTGHVSKKVTDLRNMLPVFIKLVFQSYVASQYFRIQSIICAEVLLCSLSLKHIVSPCFLWAIWGKSENKKSTLLVVLLAVLGLCFFLEWKSRLANKVIGSDRHWRKKNTGILSVVSHLINYWKLLTAQDNFPEVIWLYCYSVLTRKLRKEPLQAWPRQNPFLLIQFLTHLPSFRQKTVIIIIIINKY